MAFAGTAHLVMPPTDDRSVIEPFLAALEPGLMPADGKNVAGAVALAADALAAEPVPGTVLLVADDLGTADAAAVRQAAGRNGLVIFAVSPDSSALPAGADVIRVSIDGSDIVRLERRIETHFQAAQGDAFGTQWRDEGYWLLPPLALLSLLWFRRGTTVAWVLALFIVTHASASRAEETSRFTNLWLTPDQQGRLAFDRGDYAAAKTTFADPMWRGISAYRAYDFLAAAEEFSRVDTLEGKFALGNAQAQNHAYEKALKTYDEVLKAQPGNAAAKTNRAIVQAALDAREAKRRKQEQDDPAPPDEKADEMRVDPNQKGGKKRSRSHRRTSPLPAPPRPGCVRSRPHLRISSNSNSRSRRPLQPRGGCRSESLDRLHRLAARRRAPVAGCVCAAISGARADRAGDDRPAASRGWAKNHVECPGPGAELHDVAARTAGFSGAQRGDTTIAERQHQRAARWRALCRCAV
ncbi:tetratricopeptide (TPR) repeat protein [Bradyrhizobium sp. i1.3.1]